jgi:hypothetical protein
MEVFISWSGPRSEAAAKALREWLPKIINALKPWISSSDIDKGARWATEIATKLETARAGIICLTPSNLHSDWILFEAGALSKTVKNTFVCPLLIDLNPSDVEGPLAQFQLTKATRDDILKLLKTLNQGLEGNALGIQHIEEVFEAFWPRLSSELDRLPVDKPIQRSHRSERELIEEVLGVVRGMARNSSADGLSALPGLLEKAAIEILFNKIPNVTSIGCGSIEGANLSLNVTLVDGRSLHIALPVDTSIDQLEPRIVSQIPSTLLLGHTKLVDRINETKKRPR